MFAILIVVAHLLSGGVDFQEIAATADMNECEQLKVMYEGAVADGTITLNENVKDVRFACRMGGLD